MKRMIISLCVVCLGIGVVFPQPKLSLDRLEVNLGTMFAGIKKNGTLTLTNIGNDTLRIIAVQPSCGCTAIKKPKEYLLAGESDIVELEFNSTGYRGKIEKHVNIQTDDPTSRFVDVKIVADILEVLQPVSKTSTVWINNAIIGKPVLQMVELKNVSGVPVVIKRDSVTSPALSIKLNKKKLKPNDILAIEVTVTAQKTGYRNERLYLFTDNKNQPVIDMYVKYMGMNDK